MLNRVMEWSVRNELIIVLVTTAAILGGIWAVSQTPLEALPDLSDVQVIVQADYNEQAPRIVEDQVTYPIAAEMLKVPGAASVRGYSFLISIGRGHECSSISTASRENSPRQ